MQANYQERSYRTAAALSLTLAGVARRRAASLVSPHDRAMKRHAIQTTANRIAEARACRQHARALAAAAAYDAEAITLDRAGEPLLANLARNRARSIRCRIPAFP